MNNNTKRKFKATTRKSRAVAFSQRLGRQSLNKRGKVAASAEQITKSIGRDKVKWGNSW